MLRRVILSFLKIGTFGFGGGSALIPVVEKEVVQDNQYISESEYADHVIVSNITPGALPVKLGQLIGYDMAGISGMVLGAFMTSIPGIFIMLTVLSCISLLGEGFVHKIEYASVGISTFIIFLLVLYIQKILKDSKRQDFTKPAWILMLGTTLLTFGKELRHFLLALSIEGSFTNSTPILDLSTIDVLIFVFFIIFYTGGKFIRHRVIITSIISVIYILSFGKSQLLPIGALGGIFKAGILILALVTTISDAKLESKSDSDEKMDVLGTLKKCLPFIILSIISAVSCILLANHELGYFISNGIISTSTSFGGGEAYLTVADGIFVAEGVISTSQFYGQILPVANALPGSILVKILAGIGFALGSEFSLAQGWLLAILGFTLATSTSCIICLIVQMIYKRFSNLSIFSTLKIWILPVICGLLISTILSMINEIIKICINVGFTQVPTLAFVAIIYFIIHILHKKFHLHDVLQIFISAAISLTVLSLI